MSNTSNPKNNIIIEKVSPQNLSGSNSSFINGVKIPFLNTDALRRNLVTIRLIADTEVYSESLLNLRLINNSNVFVKCDKNNTVTIPKGTWVSMSDDSLVVPEGCVAFGKTIYMNDREVRFDKAPCRIEPQHKLTIKKNNRVNPQVHEQKENELKEILSSDIPVAPNGKIVKIAA
jgi:hypothetical protein